MTLADFIERDMEAILAHWEKFARSLPAGATMNVAALRDHAQQILKAICKDIGSSQSRAEQTQKSKGLQEPADDTETAAQTHAVLRARSGFEINQMASEYRALRASVLRLWGDACAPAPIDLNDMIRFNEAIDQALAESIEFFSAEVDRARDLLLGCLGHDMRNPLNAIQMTAYHLQRLNAGADVSKASAMLVNNCARMKALLDDLTDFSRAQLGLGVVIHVAPVNLAKEVHDEVESMRTVYPDRHIAVAAHGDTQGMVDAEQLHRVAGNLVLNALHHGTADGPVNVAVFGREEEVVLTVENQGEVLAPQTLRQMFAPLQRGPAETYDERSHMGLGLYICEQIALAHGGSIDAKSSEKGTIFTVRLPRKQPLQTVLRPQP